MILEIPNIEKMIYSTNLEVRISDINYGNHLGHDSLVSMLHEARLRFLQSIHCTELDLFGTGLLLTSLYVNYSRQVSYAEKIQINMGIQALSKTSFQFLYQAKSLDADKEIARALTVMTCYDYQKKKVTTIPNALHDYFK